MRSFVQSSNSESADHNDELSLFNASKKMDDSFESSEFNNPIFYDQSYLDEYLLTNCNFHDLKILKQVQGCVSAKKSNFLF